MRVKGYAIGLLFNSLRGFWRFFMVSVASNIVDRPADCIRLLWNGNTTVQLSNHTLMRTYTVTYAHSFHTFRHMLSRRASTWPILPTPKVLGSGSKRLILIRGPRCPASRFWVVLVDEYQPKCWIL